jgi:hypothetical protein
LSHRTSRLLSATNLLSKDSDHRGLVGYVVHRQHPADAFVLIIKRDLRRLASDRKALRLNDESIQVFALGRGLAGDGYTVLTAPVGRASCGFSSLSRSAIAVFVIDLTDFGLWPNLQ